MAEGFFDGCKYEATIKGTEWIDGNKGPGLKLYVDVVNAQGATTALNGVIWCTPATMEASTHKDGSPGRSMCERQLNAVGFTGPFSEAATIGYEVSLDGNKTLVELKQERDGDGLEVGWFVSAPTRESLAKLFGGSPPPAKPAPTPSALGAAAAAEEAGPQRAEPPSSPPAPEPPDIPDDDVPF